jgi:asparagine synthetase B (glutamine-hydrolysing)
VLDEVREALITAVHRRMMSDVGVGIFLSGGLDDAIVAAIDARRVAEHIGSDRHEVVATAGTIGEALDHAVEVIEHFDPALVRSAVPNLLPRQGVREEDQSRAHHRRGRGRAVRRVLLPPRERVRGSGGAARRARTQPRAAAPPEPATLRSHDDVRG